MKIIKSRENPIYKTAFKLMKKKYRDETGLYLLEGIKPVADAFLTGSGIRRIFICEGSMKPEGVPETDTIWLDQKLFRALSDTGTSQGVIAVAEKRRDTLDSFKMAASTGNGNIVVLDRLQDPGNIGTIIRTAEAAGYKGIVIVHGCGDIYGPKVVRAAAGSLFRMPVLYADNGNHAVGLAAELGKKLVVTSPDAEVNCFEMDLTENIALVVGNEGQGVSEELMRSCNIKVKIPMEGSIESLNAAVAAGILMYQSQKNK